MPTPAEIAKYGKRLAWYLYHKKKGTLKRKGKRKKRR